MKKGMIGWIREEFRKAGWTMLCGPADESRKKAAAGAGVIHNDRVKVMKEKIRTKRLQQAWEAGRVEKYLIDPGWERNLRQCVIYGKSGGSKDAIATTEAIMDAIEEEVNGDPIMPTIIQGGFNKFPSKLKTVKRMMEDHCWIDVGKAANWWEENREADMPCNNRSNTINNRWDSMQPGSGSPDS